MKIDNVKGPQFKVRALVIGIWLALPLSSTVAQDVGSNSPPGDDYAGGFRIEEIVVTGTAARGQDVVGSQLITFDSEAITFSGAGSTAEFLRNVPQLSEFGRPPAILGRAGTHDTVLAPSLRNIPGGTLLLVDGRRVVGSGVRQTAPDADVLPPNVFERVEVLADGASSLYGADAVAGVVNYITRRSFDGVEISGRYGVSDDYDTADLNVIAGKEWDRGSAYIAYSKRMNDSLYGRDRGYAQRLDWSTGTPFDRECEPGNVTVAGVNYALPGMVPGQTNSCDIGDDKTLYPEGRQDSVFLALSTDPTDRLRLDVKGWYTERKYESDDGPLRGTGSISPSNPFYRDTLDGNSGLSQTVQFSFAPALGNSTKQEQTLETWGITPSLSFDLGAGWQLNSFYNYGESVSEVKNAKLNTAAMSQALAATALDSALNPYDVAATSPEVLKQLANWQEYGRGKHKLHNARIGLDGPLFSIPGGDVIAAIGVEYIKEEYAIKAGDTTFGGQHGLPEYDNDRSVKAAYGELVVPIVGAGNRFKGMESLTLSLSGRHDDYSDFGSTSNAKFGISYEPLNWIKLRATWAESFLAPNLNQTLVESSALTVRPFAVVRNPAQMPPEGPFYQLFLSGGNPSLKPQEGESFTYGFDLSVPFIEGLDISMDYYDIEISGVISAAPMFSQNFFSDFPEAYTMYPSQAELEQFVALTPGGPEQLSGLASGVPVYVAIDQRFSNLSVRKTSGIDLTTRYVVDTDFGVLSAALNATHILTLKTAARAGLPFGANLDGFENPRTQGSFTVGLARERLSAQVSIVYRGALDVVPTPDNVFQSRVSSWYSVGFFTNYNFPERGDGSLLDGTSISLRVDNIFESPPVF